MKILIIFTLLNWSISNDSRMQKEKLTRRSLEKKRIKEKRKDEKKRNDGQRSKMETFNFLIVCFDQTAAACLEEHDRLLGDAY